MNETLLTALEEVSDRHILEAAAPRRRNSRLWVRSAAAVLAAAMLLVLFRPESLTASAGELISAGEYTPPKRPQQEDYANMDAYFAALDAYRSQQRSETEQTRAVMENLTEFWGDSFRVFLDDVENSLWSPVNSYLSLTIMDQLSSGSTRQEILDALGTESMEKLQTDARRIWQQVWTDTEHTRRHLASSVWLDESLSYKTENLEILGEQLYTSVHRTDLNSPEGSEKIRTWMDRQTEGILEGVSPAGTDRNGSRVLSLAATAYVNETWRENFDPERSRTGIFHAAGGDVECTFMNADMDSTDYARGENYPAIALPTNDGGRFFVILPDEGTTVAQLLESGKYLQTLFDPDPQGQKVILSMPKFDITASTDLKEGLQELGIQRAFSFTGDFSDTLGSSLLPVCVEDAVQTARITVNETGIRAGSGEFWDLISKSAAQPIHVTLDRPFLFVLMLDSIPLYAGVVAEP